VRHKTVALPVSVSAGSAFVLYIVQLCDKIKQTV